MWNNSPRSPEKWHTDNHENKKFKKLDTTILDSSFHRLKLFGIAEKIAGNKKLKINIGFENKPFYSNNWKLKIHSHSTINFDETNISTQDVDLINNYYTQCQNSTPEEINTIKMSILEGIIKEIEGTEHQSRLRERSTQKPQSQNDIYSPKKDDVKSYFGDYYNSGEVDFVGMVKNLWHKKIESTKDPKIIKFLNDKNSPYQIYLRWNHTSTTLENYSRNIESSINEVRQNIKRNEITINWNKLTPEQADIVRDISATINEKDILSFLMTEMFGWSKNPLTSMKLLSFILKNWWEEFLDLQPSMNDKKFCMWPYQLSDSVVWITQKDGVKYYGAAAQVQLALPENKRIATDISRIKGREQHKATFLNIIYNLWLLVQKLWNNPHGLKTLKANSNKKSDILAYLAMSHQNPENAIRTAKAWIESWCKKPLSTYSEKRYSEAYLSRRDQNSKVIAKL